MSIKYYYPNFLDSVTNPLESKVLKMTQLLNGETKILIYFYVDYPKYFQKFLLLNKIKFIIPITGRKNTTLTECIRLVGLP